QVSQHAVLRTKILLSFGACFAIAAESMRRQQHTLARLKIGDIFADLSNIAGNVAPIDVRQLDPGQTFADEKIQVVQRTRLHSHQNLIFARLGVWNVFKLQNVRTAEFMEANGFHFLPPEERIANLSKIHHGGTGTGPKFGKWVN